MKLTRELLHPKNHCGHTRKQLELLGVSWPPEKGWLTRLIGTEIPAARYAQFVALSRAGKRREPRIERHEPDLFTAAPAESPESYANRVFEKNRRDFM